MQPADQIDAEGWETVQRGRPVRSRSSAMTIKSDSPSVTEHKLRDDSDKENNCTKAPIEAPEETAKSELPPVLVEPPPKELLCPCEIPLTEVTQIEILAGPKSQSAHAPPQADHGFRKMAAGKAVHSVLPHCRPWSRSIALMGHPLLPPKACSIADCLTDYDLLERSIGWLGEPKVSTQLKCILGMPYDLYWEFTVHRALEELKSTGTFPPQATPPLPCLDIPVVFLDPLSKKRKAEVTCTVNPAGGARSSSDLDLSNVSAGKLSMAEVLAKKEELADRLEKANEEAIASAIAEEEQLTREIAAEENDIEMDNESDFSASMGSGSMSFSGMSMDWNEVLADYEARESWRQNTSWGDIVEEEPSRPPGHGIHMHEKLSSPSRKRTIAESKKKHEEKQRKAQQLREKLQEEKALKVQKLLEREKDVRKWKEELLEQRRKMMDEKLLHAEFKREVQLQAIVKKAQEEEAKVNEIAFINTLEAQNKRHDVLAKLKEYEQRLNELQEERQRRQEEKQARDEAVQERKRVLEAERQARVEELLMKRKEQEARIEMQRQEKERAREDAARERASADCYHFFQALLVSTECSAYTSMAIRF
ncbi:unnamed protein product [Ranitomeya imitator]|uniref:S phase cyclin A-associated protein in the endoplasmic reticulum N-terminal domain-containing protein n=1 Tax=Ranitomeya imitator TaxID=111125 RepID=A0ABN9MDM1_9NEOB|nr:unnamed protein product [Ranitomeya imitator]